MTDVRHGRELMGADERQHDDVLRKHLAGSPRRSARAAAAGVLTKLSLVPLLSFFKIVLRSLLL